MEALKAIYQGSDRDGHAFRFSWEDLIKRLGDSADYFKTLTAKTSYRDRNEALAKKITALQQQTWNESEKIKKAHPLAYLAVPPGKYQGEDLARPIGKNEFETLRRAGSDHPEVSVQLLAGLHVFIKHRKPGDDKMIETILKPSAEKFQTAATRSLAEIELSLRGASTVSDEAISKVAPGVTAPEPQPAASSQVLTSLPAVKPTLPPLTAQELQSSVIQRDIDAAMKRALKNARRGTRQEMRVPIHQFPTFDQVVETFKAPGGLNFHPRMGGMDLSQGSALYNALKERHQWAEYLFEAENAFRLLGQVVTTILEPLEERIGCATDCLLTMQGKGHQIVDVIKYLAKEKPEIRLFLPGAGPYSEGQPEKMLEMVSKLIVNQKTLAQKVQSPTLLQVPSSSEKVQASFEDATFKVAFLHRTPEIDALMKEAEKISGGALSEFDLDQAREKMSPGAQPIFKDILKLLLEQSKPAVVLKHTRKIQALKNALALQLSMIKFINLMFYRNVDSGMTNPTASLYETLSYWTGMVNVKFVQPTLEDREPTLSLEEIKANFKRNFIVPETFPWANLEGRNSNILEAQNGTYVASEQILDTLQDFDDLPSDAIYANPKDDAEKKANQDFTIWRTQQRVQLQLWDISEEEQKEIRSLLNRIYSIAEDQAEAAGKNLQDYILASSSMARKISRRYQAMVYLRDDIFGRDEQPPKNRTDLASRKMYDEIPGVGKANTLDEKLLHIQILKEASRDTQKLIFDERVMALTERDHYFDRLVELKEVTAVTALKIEKINNPALVKEVSFKEGAVEKYLPAIKTLKRGQRIPETILHDIPHSPDLRKGLLDALIKSPKLLVVSSQQWAMAILPHVNSLEEIYYAFATAVTAENETELENARWEMPRVLKRLDSILDKEKENQEIRRQFNDFFVRHKLSNRNLGGIFAHWLVDLSDFPAILNILYENLGSIDPELAQPSLKILHEYDLVVTQEKRKEDEKKADQLLQRALEVLFQTHGFQTENYRTLLYHYYTNWSNPTAWIPKIAAEVFETKLQEFSRQTPEHRQSLLKFSNYQRLVAFMRNLVESMTGEGLESNPEKYFEEVLNKNNNRDIHERMRKEAVDKGLMRSEARGKKENGGNGKDKPKPPQETQAQRERREKAQQRLEGAKDFHDNSNWLIFMEAIKKSNVILSPAKQGEESGEQSSFIPGGTQDDKGKTAAEDHKRIYLLAKSLELAGLFEELKKEGMLEAKIFDDDTALFAALNGISQEDFLLRLSSLNPPPAPKSPPPKPVAPTPATIPSPAPVDDMPGIPERLKPVLRRANQMENDPSWQWKISGPDGEEKMLHEQISAREYLRQFIAAPASDRKNIENKIYHFINENPTRFISRYMLVIQLGYSELNRHSRIETFTELNNMITSLQTRFMSESRPPGEIFGDFQVLSQMIQDPAFSFFDRGSFHSLSVTLQLQMSEIFINVGIDPVETRKMLAAHVKNSQIAWLLRIHNIPETTSEENEVSPFLKERKYYGQIQNVDLIQKISAAEPKSFQYRLAFMKELIKEWKTKPKDAQAFEIYAEFSFRETLQQTQSVEELFHMFRTIDPDELMVMSSDKSDKMENLLIRLLVERLEMLLQNQAATHEFHQIFNRYPLEVLWGEILERIATLSEEQDFLASYPRLGKAIELAISNTNSHISLSHLNALMGAYADLKIEEPEAAKRMDSFVRETIKMALRVPAGSQESYAKLHKMLGMILGNQSVVDLFKTVIKETLHEGLRNRYFSSIQFFRIERIFKFAFGEDPATMNRILEVQNGESLFARAIHEYPEGDDIYDKIIKAERQKLASDDWQKEFYEITGWMTEDYEKFVLEQRKVKGPFADKPLQPETLEDLIPFLRTSRVLETYPELAGHDLAKGSLLYEALEQAFLRHQYFQTMQESYRLLAQQRLYESKKEDKNTRLEFNVLFKLPHPNGNDQQWFRADAVVFDSRNRIQQVYFFPLGVSPLEGDAATFAKQEEKAGLALNSRRIENLATQVAFNNPSFFISYLKREENDIPLAAISPLADHVQMVNWDETATSATATDFRNILTQLSNMRQLDRKALQEERRHHILANRNIRVQRLTGKYQERLLATGHHDLANAVPERLSRIDRLLADRKDEEANLALNQIRSDITMTLGNEESGKDSPYFVDASNFKVWLEGERNFIWTSPSDVLRFLNQAPNKSSTDPTINDPKSIDTFLRMSNNVNDWFTNLMAGVDLSSTALSNHEKQHIHHLIQKIYQSTSEEEMTRFKILILRYAIGHFARRSYIKHRISYIRIAEKEFTPEKIWRYQHIQIPLRYHMLGLAHHNLAMQSAIQCSRDNALSFGFKARSLAETKRQMVNKLGQLLPQIPVFLGRGFQFDDPDLHAFDLGYLAVIEQELRRKGFAAQSMGNLDFWKTNDNKITQAIEENSGKAGEVFLQIITTVMAQSYAQGQSLDAFKTVVPRWFQALDKRLNSPEVRKPFIKSLNTHLLYQIALHYFIGLIDSSFLNHTNIRLAFEESAGSDHPEIFNTVWILAFNLFTQVRPNVGAQIQEKIDDFYKGMLDNYFEARGFDQESLPSLTMSETLSFLVERAAAYYKKSLQRGENPDYKVFEDALSKSIASDKHADFSVVERTIQQLLRPEARSRTVFERIREEYMRSKYDLQSDTVQKELYAHVQKNIRGYEKENYEFPSFDELMDYLAANPEERIDILSTHRGLDLQKAKAEYEQPKGERHREERSDEAISDSEIASPPKIMAARNDGLSHDAQLYEQLLLQYTRARWRNSLENAYQNFATWKATENNLFQEGRFYHYLLPLDHPASYGNVQYLVADSALIRNGKAEEVHFYVLGHTALHFEEKPAARYEIETIALVKNIERLRSLKPNGIDFNHTKFKVTYLVPQSNQSAISVADVKFEIFSMPASDPDALVAAKLLEVVSRGPGEKIDAMNQDIERFDTAVRVYQQLNMGSLILSQAPIDEAARSTFERLIRNIASNSRWLGLLSSFPRNGHQKLNEIDGKIRKLIINLKLQSFFQIQNFQTIYYDSSHKTYANLDAKHIAPATSLEAHQALSEAEARAGSLKPILEEGQRSEVRKIDRDNSLIETTASYLIQNQNPRPELRSRIVTQVNESGLERFTKQLSELAGQIAGNPALAAEIYARKLPSSEDPAMLEIADGFNARLESLGMAFHPDQRARVVMLTERLPEPEVLIPLLRAESRMKLAVVLMPQEKEQGAWGTEQGEKGEAEKMEKEVNGVTENRLRLFVPQNQAAFRVALSHAAAFLRPAQGGENSEVVYVIPKESANRADDVYGKILFHRISDSDPQRLGKEYFLLGKAAKLSQGVISGLARAEGNHYFFDGQSVPEINLSAFLSFQAEFSRYFGQAA